MHPQVTITHANSTLFRCQPYSDQYGLVYTPNIPDFYFKPESTANFMAGSQANLTTTSIGVTDIFTIPVESATVDNCSGRVVALQYCYQTRNEDIGTLLTVFHLSLLTSEGLQNNTIQFTINRLIPICSTPQNGICTNRVANIRQTCCDITYLSSDDQFQSTSIYYGVTTGNGNTLPVAFRNGVGNDAQHYLISLGTPPDFGEAVVVSRSTLADDGVIILRFILGN